MKFFTLLFIFSLSFNVLAKDIPIFPKKDIVNINEETFSWNSLDTNKSNVILIAFWATWCNPCISELKKLKKIQKKYNIPVYYINEDEPKTFDQVKPFIKTRRVNKFIVLWDKNKELYNSLGLNGIPQIYIIDKKFNILYSHNGYKKGDEKELEEKLKELINK